MTLPAVDSDRVAARLSLIRPHLDERAWRLLLGAEAKVLGRGGIKLVAAAGGVHPDTVAQGVRELDYDEPIPGRVRRPGAGRPAMAVTDPDLVAALDALVDPVSRGDPESPLRWTTKSTAKLAAELTAMGHRVSARTVAKLLKQAGYSLQANSKTLEGAQHRDRDAQFGYLNTQVERFQADGDPVISVDTKKKELVGRLQERWPGMASPAASPSRSRCTTSPTSELGKAVPYGVYDVAANTGWVNVGTDHDTVAVRRAGHPPLVGHRSARTAYPDAGRLLICADGGGSNGYRTRLWKTELAEFAAETGLDITRLPPAPGHHQ